MLKQKNAFTLAEVMVTLAVVGILASVMLPVISKARPNKQKSMFKKAYYVTERIVYELVNDEDLYPSSGNAIGFQNTSEVSYLGKSYGSNTNVDLQKKKFCQLFARKVNTLSDEDNCSGTSSYFNDISTFTTTDGIVWYVPYTNFSGNNAQTIHVDVNGPASPNCKFDENRPKQCPNPDTFEIKVEADGKIYVNGPKEKEYLSSNNSLR